MTVVTMVIRLDAYSLIYGVLVAILLPCSRRICYILWPLYIIVLAILLGPQYLACLGVPPALCWGMFQCFGQRRVLKYRCKFS